MSQTTPSGADSVPMPVMQVLHKQVLTPLCTHHVMGYTVAQITAYRDACVAAATSALIARNAELDAERDALAAERDKQQDTSREWAQRASALAAENKAMRQTLEELTCAVAPMLEAKVCCEPITVVDPDPTARHRSVSTWSPYPLMSFRQEDMWELKRMHGIATAALARTPAKENDDG